MGDGIAQIRATYDRTEHRIVLASSVPNSGWMSVWRAAHDTTDDVVDISPTEMSVPVWAFLNIRLYIKDAIQRKTAALQVDDQVRALLQRALADEKSLSEASTVERLPLNAIQENLGRLGFRRQLKPWQEKNLCAIAHLNAAADFSVPGSGKTTEALAYWWLRKGERDRLLVVAPKNAFAPWEEQIAICLPPDVSVTRLVGSRDDIAERLHSKPSVALINYHKLSQPAVHKIVSAYVADNAVSVFLDESHKIKRGEDGIWGNAALSIAHLAHGKLIMSGTPMPNSTADLVAQLRFLHPEADVDETTATARIQPIFVRTTKDDLDIPPIRERIVDVELLPGQRRFYNMLSSAVAREAEAVLTRRQRFAIRSLGKSVMRVLKFVSNPALLLPDIAVTEAAMLRDILLDEESQKIEYAIRFARRLAKEGQKTIIWSSFIANVELIAERLSDLGADFIHGGVDTGSEEDDTRERRIKRFHDPGNAFVLVANPAAAGEAISLHTVCHNAIYVDRNYNAAQFLQSEDRIHRVGLKPTDKTNVYILSSPGTIDESVERRLRDKIRVMSEVLKDASLHVEPIREDVEDEDLAEADIRDFVESVATKA